MRSLRNKALGLLGAVGFASISLIVTTGTATAAAPPPCRGPSGSFCITLVNNSTTVHSVRGNWNGGCLIGVGPGQRGNYPNTWVSKEQFDRYGDNLFTFFQGEKCEGNTKTRASINSASQFPGETYRSFSFSQSPTS